MGDLSIAFLFFLFVMSLTALGMMLFNRYAARKEAQLEAQLADATRGEGLRGAVTGSVRYFGELFLPRTGDPHHLRRTLVAAGYKLPSAPTVFYGIKISIMCLMALVLGWVGLIGRESVEVAGVLTLCGAGMGYMLPDRVLTALVARRTAEIERGLPAALDLMVLSVEAGQPLDHVIFETSRELALLYPELCAELQQAQLELRAGRTRQEVLWELGERSGSQELRKVATILIDADRFGTSLGPNLRTHARYLRTRRRQAAQEEARKLGVKLIFPVFFLIMPSVFVVTLGPAVLQIYQALKPMR